MTVDEARAEAIAMMLGDGAPLPQYEAVAVVDALIAAVRDEERAARATEQQIHTAFLNTLEQMTPPKAL